MSLGIPGVEQLHEIGRGGSGVVYRAWQPAFGRWVAVKVFPPDEDARRLERERLAVGRLSDHPGIAPVFGGGLASDGRAYLLMGYMEGGSLRDRVAARGPLPPAEAAAFGQAMARALQVAHDHGIWHRDIKPANILYDRFGAPRLADFGIAHIGEDGYRTGAGLISGTAAYLAPELLEGNPFTAASDVFSLGATLYYALAGQAMFVPQEGESSPSFLLRRLTRPELPPFPPTVPEWMRSIVIAATAPDPRERIPTAAGLAESLAAQARPAPARPPDRPSTWSGTPASLSPTAPAQVTPAPVDSPFGRTGDASSPWGAPGSRPFPGSGPAANGSPQPPPGVPVGGPARSPSAPGRRRMLAVQVISSILVLLVLGVGSVFLHRLPRALSSRTGGSDSPTGTSGAATPGIATPATGGTTGSTTGSGDPTGSSRSTATGADAVNETLAAYRTALGTSDPKAIRVVFYPHPDAGESPYAIATLVAPDHPTLVDEYNYWDGVVKDPKPEKMTASEVRKQRWKFSDVSWKTMATMLRKTDTVCRKAMTAAGVPDQADEDGRRAGLAHIIVERDDAFYDNKVVLRVYFHGGARWSGGYVVFSASGKLITGRYCQVD